MHLYFFFMDALCYALARTCMLYDVVMPYVMIMRVRLKEIHFRDLCFSNSFKIEFMHVQLFITKPEVAGTTTMTY